MQKLAEHEIQIKGLWDQYSVRLLVFFSVEPLRGELPVRFRAPHLLLPRQLGEPRAALEHPRDRLLRRRAAAVGPGAESAAAQLEGTFRPHLQHCLESAEFPRLRGGFAPGPEPHRRLRNGFLRQYAFFASLMTRDGENLGDSERRAGPPTNAVGTPESRIGGGVSPEW